MSYQKVKKLIIVLVQGVIIAGVVIFSVCPLSCKLTPEGIKIIGGDYVSPKLENCKVVDEKHIELDFSENVKLSSVSITEKDSFGIEDIENNDKSLLCNLESKIVSVPESEKIIVELTNNTEIGKNYIICGVVEDKIGNTLTFAAPFKGYNSRVPRLIITDLLHKDSDISNSSKRRNEFVKFIAVEDGNLFGLVVGSGYYGEERDFHLPAIDVKKGDIIVVHLRNKGDGCINELGDDLQLSTSGNSYNNGRDLWFDNKDPVLQNEHDVVYLRDTINNQLIDGIMYAHEDETEWPVKLIPYIEELKNKGFISSTNIKDACNVKGISGTKPMHRINTNEIQLKLKNNEKIDFPILTCKDDWTGLEKKYDPGRVEK